MKISFKCFCWDFSTFINRFGIPPCNPFSCSKSLRHSDSLKIKCKTFLQDLQSHPWPRPHLPVCFSSAMMVEIVQINQSAWSIQCSTKHLSSSHSFDKQSCMSVYGGAKLCCWYLRTKEPRSHHLWAYNLMQRGRQQMVSDSYTVYNKGISNIEKKKQDKGESWALPWCTIL